MHVDQLEGGVGLEMVHHEGLQVLLACGLIQAVGRLEDRVPVRFVGKG